MLFSPTAGDGGVQHGFRRRVGGAMKGAVAPSSSSSSSSSSSMQNFENEDEDDAASLLLDPTGPAQPARGLTGLRHHAWDSVVNAFNPMIYVHCLANGFERSDTSRSTARARPDASAKVVTNRRFTNNEVRIMKERPRQQQRNGIDFDILRFSIRQSAVQLGCGRRPR